MREFDEEKTRGRRGVRRSRLTVLFVMVAGLGAAACDDPAAPDVERVARAVPATVAAVGSGSPFHPNTMRYRNTGATATTARAGQATLTAWALMDATGRTEVTLIADTASLGNPLPTGGPELGMVQLKAYGADGRLRFARTDATGPGATGATYLVGGLVSGDRVQVQANVTGADPARTGVVTLTTGVLRRPQLRVESVSAPIRAAARTAINISALVRETNGDLGGTASCALFVNGVEVDRAWSMWIDAGGAASCVFMHFFPDVGTYDLEVRIVDVHPRAFETDMSSATATMSVIHIPSAFWFAAQFDDRTFEESWRAQGSFRLASGSEGGEWQDERNSSGRTQHGAVWGSLPHPVTFPLAELFVRQYTRDEVAHVALFLAVEPSWTYEDPYMRETCVATDFVSANGRAWLHLCSVEHLGEYGGGWTSVTYERHAGQVTYHSRGYSRYWNRDLGIDDVWSWNYESQDHMGRFVSYGFEYGFTLRIVDEHGVYAMNPLVWMQPYEYAYDNPWTCWQWSDPWASQENCSESRNSARGVRGEVYGEPTY